MNVTVDHRYGSPHSQHGAYPTLIALAIFGYIKGHFTGAPPLRSANQTVLIGGVAAAAAFMIARVIS